MTDAAKEKVLGAISIILDEQYKSELTMKTDDFTLDITYVPHYNTLEI